MNLLLHEKGFKYHKDTEFFLSDNTKFGANVIFGPGCKKITIGFGCFLGDDVYIDVPELHIGDYTTVHRGTTIHGYKSCLIGHNCWIGQFSIIDSIGGTSIGNNVGIGAHSQLWSHIKFGDTLEGCVWNKTSELIVEEDVWFVGHCIISPIRAKKKSMLLVGGVITKDMEENHVYAGVPAKDVTSQFGNQFVDIDYTEKVEMFNRYYLDFLTINNLTAKEYQITIVDDLSSYIKNNCEITYFNFLTRSYLPTRSINEYKFMKYLLYDKAKFIPYLT